MLDKKMDAKIRKKEKEALRARKNIIDEDLGIKAKELAKQEREARIRAKMQSEMTHADNMLTETNSQSQYVNGEMSNSRSRHGKNLSGFENHMMNSNTMQMFNQTF